MNICDIIIKYTDDTELFGTYFEECQKVRPINDQSEKLGRTYFMIASQFGSVNIMKAMNALFPTMKIDILDNMGRGPFTVAKDE